MAMVKLSDTSVSSFSPSVSVIIPAHNGAAYLPNCMASLKSVTFPPFELIVVDDNSTDETVRVAEECGARVVTSNQRSRPAAARNLGAQMARGEILVFLDADVFVHPDSVSRLVNVLIENRDAAAVFGSYDASPTGRNLVSQFRNLLHHYVHQTADSNATTFWAGCGAVRRSIFLEWGGFDTRYQYPSVEDIELGIRLHQAGYRILLDPQTQVTHAKPWSLGSMLSCDLWSRGLPWTRLILRRHAFPNDLNLKYAQRFSVLSAGLCAATFAFAVWSSPWLVVLPILVLLVIAAMDAWTSKTDNPVVAHGFGITLLMLGAVIACRFSVWAALSMVPFAITASLNTRFYVRMGQQRGLLFAILCIPLHVLHYLSCGIAFTCGIGWHFLEMLTTSFGLSRSSTAVPTDREPARSDPPPRPLSIPPSEAPVLDD